jgi:hypothetical protein
LSWELKTKFAPSHLAQLKEDIGARLTAPEEPPKEGDRSDDDFTKRGVLDL